MFEGALMYGISSNKIMNVARQIDYQSADFITKIPVKVATVGPDQVGYTVFSDTGAGSNALGIETHMTSYSYSKPPNNGFIILKTSFHNTTSKDITGLYAGYYIDWDIPASDYNNDTTYFDALNNIAIAVNNNLTNPNVYQKVFTGTSLISANANSYIYYGIDNSSLTDSVVLSDANGFSDSEKWFALSRGDKTKTAGGDISLVVSGGPFIVHAKDSINVAYAIAAATTIDSLRSAIVHSKAKYLSITGINVSQNKLPDNFALFQNYPNPFNPSTIISYQLPEASIVQIKIYDVLGREVATLINEQKPVGKYNIVWNGTDYKGNKVSSGVYMYRIQTVPLTPNSKSFTASKKMVLIK
jgi:hypothetical protein